MNERHPQHEASGHVDRREFLRLMGASLAFAGLSGCSLRYPVEKIVPYVRRPPVSGTDESVYYATALNIGGFGFGVLAESFAGRPVKIEGNPLHPASLGATDVFAQAAVLSLYDPDRSKVVTREGAPSSWESFTAEFRSEASKLDRGTGLRILSRPTTSPTLLRLMTAVLQAFPGAAWHQFEPVNRDNEREGALLAFGTDVQPIYDLTSADVIVSLGSDFLADPAGGVRYAHDLASKRRVRSDSTQMSRLYVLETMPSVTGSFADRRIALKPSAFAGFASAIQASVNGFAFPSPQPAESAALIKEITSELTGTRGRSLVIAGQQQPAAVHAAVHAINSSLQNIGKTVSFIPPVKGPSVSCSGSIRDLVRDMRSGAVQMIVILGGNPAYDAPADLDFGGALKNVPFTAHLGQYLNETAKLCRWHIPQAHDLESWGDARSFDGTASITQPLISPMYSGKTVHELVAALAGNVNASSHDLVRQTWSVPQSSDSAKEMTLWNDVLEDGVVAGTAPAKSQVNITLAPVPPTDRSDSIEVSFLPDPSVWDGTYANNGWLQELPKPVTKLNWGNAAMMSGETANKLGLSNDVAGVGGSHGQVIAPEIELSLNGRSITAPAFVVDGHANDVITLHLGGGRTAAGEVGNGVGANAYALRASDAMDSATGVNVRATGRTVSLACTQNHHSMEGRDLLRSASLAQYDSDPRFSRRQADEPTDERSLFSEWPYNGHAWAMVIDTSVCVGCNACVIACQAENNIPVVGKEEVQRGREMHWIRIDQYNESRDGEVAVLNQPIPCQHCENAPCEVVCPVEATSHSSEGLNEMVYNRCVGTRYCSNNCPYKVRRFNFFGYSDLETPLVQLGRNPEVTTRSRGVMEKCTYCVQRIQNVKIRAEREGRDVADGEIVTACEQACPTQAIVFGDKNDANSRVAALRREPSNYSLLGELNTRPRTTYLPVIRNI